MYVRLRSELLDSILHKMVSLCMIFKSTLCKCVSKANFRTKFYRTKNVFETFKIGLTQLKTKRKKITLWTKYLKTHVDRVISKIVFPHPHLDVNFKTHKMLVTIFYYLYKYIYTCNMFYIGTKYEENWRTLLISHPSHPYHRSIPKHDPSGLVE